MPFLLPLLIRMGLRERIARPLATILTLAAVAALCGTLGYCKGRSDGKAQVLLEVSEFRPKVGTSGPQGRGTGEPARH